MDHLHSTFNESSNDESEDNVQSSVAIRLLVAAQSFNQVYTPLLCLFGALGNLLSVTVFCRTPTHRSLSASFYLSALAISDTGFLFNLLAVWLEDMGLHVITSPVVCPTVMYMGQVTCFLSVWFIVAFTMERFFAVCYPLTRPTVCTVARAKKVIIILTLTALIGFSYVGVIARVLSYPSERPNLVINPITTSTLNYYEVNLSHDFTLGNFYNTSIPDFATFSSSASNLTLEDLRKSSPGNSNFGMNLTSNVTIEYISICSVREEHVYFSSIASHIDSVLTLILPFGIIAYLNVRISLCVWKLKDQRENLVAMAKVSSQNNRGRGTQVGFVYRASKRHVTSCATGTTVPGIGAAIGPGSGSSSTGATIGGENSNNINVNANSTCNPNMNLNMNSLHPNSNLNLNRGFSSRDLGSPGQTGTSLNQNLNHNHLHVNSACSSPILGSDNMSNHSYTRSSRTNLTVDFDTSESVSTTSTSNHCCSDFSSRTIKSNSNSKNRIRIKMKMKSHSNNNMRRTRKLKGRLNGSSHAKAEARVTKTLLLVSTVFLVLNTPSHAIRAFTFVQSFWEIKVGNEALFACQLWANILFNANFAVNFLLYCVSGRNFRVSLVSLFCKGNGLSRYPKSKRNHDRSPSTFPSPSAKSRDSFYPMSVTEVETYA